MSQHYDIAILGAGSAGYWAARTAAKLGAKTALVDPGPLGGLCILRGCMPSKALLRTSEVMHLARHAHEVGVLVKEVGYDWEKVMARKRHWVEEFASYRREGITRQDGFELINEAARFLDPHTLQVGDRQITADKIIVATGSVVHVPDIPGLRDTGYITSDEALELAAPPSSMLVLGGGVIALELGQFYARMGTKVTIVVRGERILSGEDEDVALALQQCLVDEGIEVVNHALMERFECRNGKKVLHALKHGACIELEADEIMLALGRHPNVACVDSSAGGFEAHPHIVPVNEHYQTSQPHIYAVGDANGRYFIVHVAIQQGIHAVMHALGKQPTPLDPRMLAWAIFSDPNVARVGYSERELEKQGVPFVVGKYPFDDQGKALVSNLTKGFVKVVAHRDSGEILGACVVGAEGSDLIHEMIVAMHFRATCQQFLEIPHLHPTLSEIWLDPVEECEDKRTSQPVGV